MSSDRATRRGMWEVAAAGWARHADQLRREGMAVSAWMIEALEPQPGQTLLELAAGVGDTGFLAAELIQPGGTLISSDNAPAMLSAAQARAETLDVRNVRFRQLDPEVSLELDTASVDGVLCRFGYMLMEDSETALRETRRVLKPGARVALAVWGDATENPAVATAGGLLARHGLIDPPQPGAIGPFRWGQEGIVADELERAGFVEHVVEPLRFEARFASFDEWWEITLDTAIWLRPTLERAGSAKAEQLREDARAALERYAAPDGSLPLPAMAWVAWAAA